MTRSIAELGPQARQSLVARIPAVTVTYADHPLPVGSDPAIARVGIGADAGGVVLYVDRHVSYSGDDPEVAAWLNAGERQFARFEDLERWLRAVLPLPPASPSVPARLRPMVAAPAELTDLNGVLPRSAPPTGVSEDDLRRLLLHSISGQRTSLDRLAAAVSRHTGKAFPRRPYSALFIGTSGTGKTATARALAAGLTELSPVEWRTLRIDAAELTEALSVSRLVGAAPNYVGYGDGSNLAARLAEHPYNVVLFDEIEKAHPAVINALLALLDVGRLRADRPDDTTSERSILLFTSNLGAERVDEGMQRDDVARAHLRAHGLAPELVARFGDVLAFLPLQGGELAEVVARLVGTVAADYGLVSEWIAPTYIEDVIARASSNRFGVRILEYMVDTDLGPHFARLAAAQVSRVRVDFDEGPVVTVAQVQGSDWNGDPENAGRGL